MKKIGDYDPFFDFFIFSSKRWLGTKKKITIPKVLAIFKRENFLNIGKDRNSLAIKSAEKKGRLLTELTLFFASLWKCKLLNPRSARCARYAWGQFLNFQLAATPNFFSATP
jgi:hypothetical protein